MRIAILGLWTFAACIGCAGESKPPAQVLVEAQPVGEQPITLKIPPAASKATVQAVMGDALDALLKDPGTQLRTEWGVPLGTIVVDWQPLLPQQDRKEPAESEWESTRATAPGEAHTVYEYRIVMQPKDEPRLFALDRRPLPGGAWSKRGSADSLEAMRQEVVNTLVDDLQFIAELSEAVR